MSVFPPRGGVQQNTSLIFGIGGGRSGDAALSTFILATAGTVPITAPSMATKMRAIAIGPGGGGAGGKVTATDIIEAGAGGGGGGYAEGIFPISPNQSITCISGAGGTAGAIGSAGGNGGTS